MQKTNFDRIYVNDSPNEYYKALSELEYREPDFILDWYTGLTRRRKKENIHERILDLGCSYGINSHAFKKSMTFRETKIDLENSQTAEISTTKESEEHAPYVIGIDSSAPAVSYAESTGLIDSGYALDLNDEETHECVIQKEKKEITLCTASGIFSYVKPESIKTLISNLPVSKHFEMHCWPVYGSMEEESILATFSTDGFYIIEKPCGPIPQRLYGSNNEEKSMKSALIARGYEYVGTKAQTHLCVEHICVGVR